MLTLLITALRYSKVKSCPQSHKIYKAGLLLNILSAKVQQTKIHLGSLNTQHDNYFGTKDRTILIGKLIKSIKGETCCINRHFNKSETFISLKRKKSLIKLKHLKIITMFSQL